MYLLIVAFLFCFGAVFEEAQGNHNFNNYLSERKCSHGRQFLTLKFLVVGVLIASSYKSVLRASLMKVEYESTIDTLDDLLESGRTFLVPKDTPLGLMYATDPREKVKMLAKQTLLFEYGRKTPEHLVKGYSLNKSIFANCPE